MEWIVFGGRRIHPSDEHSCQEWVVFFEALNLVAAMAHQTDVNRYGTELKTLCTFSHS
jgi:hypothetical protein